MHIKVNGKEEVLGEASCTVMQYLEGTGIRPELVAVERNGSVLDKREYNQTYLQEGDIIEIVKFVGGGS